MADACKHRLSACVLALALQPVLQAFVLQPAALASAREEAIYNADGHERFGPHNRINQNGPEETGWRTQARNLNLKRDIGPYLTFRDDADPLKGATAYQDLPRFSSGYMILQNRAGMLVEMHMLKDYRTRVSGNYELLRALLEVIHRDARQLVQMNREADAATIAAGGRRNPGARFPLRLEADGGTELFLYRGYAVKRELSDISGAMRVEYTRTPVEIEIPRSFSLRVTRSVALPAAYIVPAPWASMIEVLAAHSLTMLKTTRDWSSEVETYRCRDPKWMEHPFEGRQVLFYPGEGLPQSAAALGPCAPVRERVRSSLNFFYQRSPWWDSRLGLYPVGRLSSLEEVPIPR